MSEEGLPPTPVPKAFFFSLQGQLMLPNSFVSCQNSSRHLQANIYRDCLFFFFLNQIVADGIHVVHFAFILF